MAIQTYENIDYFIKALHKDNYPLLRQMLCIGGMNVSEQVQVLKKYFIKKWKNKLF